MFEEFVAERRSWRALPIVSAAWRDISDGFLRRQPARLQQYFIRHADLADIVQQRRDFQQIARFVVEFQHRGPRAAAERDA